MYVDSLKMIFFLFFPMFLVAAPSAPSGLQLQALSSSSVSLSWQRSNVADDRGFKILRDGKLIAIVPKGVTHYEDNGLTPKTTYTYIVKATDDERELSGANLLFASGFEGDVSISGTIDPDALDYRNIVGLDSETGFSWPIEILGAKGSGLHYISDNNMEAVKQDIVYDEGYDGSMTHMLHGKGSENIADDTQCPYEILEIKEGQKDLYIRFRIKLNSRGLSGIENKNKWRTFFEWKTHGYGDGTGFRLISVIEMDDDGNPFWVWQGDDIGDNLGKEPIWKIENHTVAVPLDEWFTTEFYWHWSEGSDGRALWRVNHQVVGDKLGATTVNGQVLDFIMLGQIYGNASYKEQWIDDIEIWDGLPTDEDTRVRLLPPVDDNDIYFGAFAGFGAKEDAVTAESLDSFKLLAGKKLSIAPFTMQWLDGIVYPESNIKRLHAKGVIPLVRMAPRNTLVEEVEEIKYTLDKIIEGVFDTNLTKWAKDAKAHGIPILIDFGYEMNGKWFPWNGDWNGKGKKDGYGDKDYPDGPERYRDAYRHIIGIFREVGTKNVTWFFHPTMHTQEPKVWWNEPKWYYPGDNYIDWVGMSIYGMLYPAQNYWDTFDETLEDDDAFQKMLEITKNKPFSILELGVSDEYDADGTSLGKKATWFTDAFNSILSHKYNLNFRLLTYWHENWDNDGSLTSLKIDSSPSSLEAFKTGIADERFISEGVFFTD